MKTKQEQTKQMLKILCDKFQCSAIDRSYMAKSCRQCEDIVEALHEAGYGDIKQAKIDVLKELKTRHDYANKNMGYPWDISQQIDELLTEVEKQ